MAPPEPQPVDKEDAKLIFEKYYDRVTSHDQQTTPHSIRYSATWAYGITVWLNEPSFYPIFL
jgi:hypothetical protein